jgi:hypothetical protein
VKDFHSRKRAFSQIPHLSTLRLNVGFPPMPPKSQKETRKTLQFLRLGASEKILQGVAQRGDTMPRLIPGRARVKHARQ